MTKNKRPSKDVIEQALMKRDAMLGMDNEISAIFVRAIADVLDENKGADCLVDSIEKIEGVLQFAKTWAKAFHETSIISGSEKE